MNLREQTYLWYIVILRLYIGYYLLQQGILKYLRGFPQSDWINRQIGDLNKVELYTWYKSFLINVVVPHRELFGYLVTSGEILIGLLSCAGTADSFEFHCGNFHVAQLLLRAWHGKRRRFPCTAADFHSCVGGSYTLQRRKDLGPRCIAIQKTVAVKSNSN